LYDSNLKNEINEKNEILKKKNLHKNAGKISKKTIKGVTQIII